jgi:cell division septum initiation protein DivIVA
MRMVAYEFVSRGHHSAGPATRRIASQRHPRFTNRARSARRRMQEIERMTAKQRHDHQQGKYRELISITEQVVGNARRVLEQTKVFISSISSTTLSFKRRAGKSNTTATWGIA